MDQDEFIDAMAAKQAGLRDRPPDWRERAGRAATSLLAAVPIVARCSILAGIAYLGWEAYLNRYLLLLVGAAIVWTSRGDLSRFITFGPLLGSASFMTIGQMRRAGYLGGDSGLILGRARDMKPSRLSASLNLATRPLAESEGLIRSFLLAMSGRRIDVVRARDQPLIRLPRYIHTVLIGPAGSGKNVSYIFPTILSYGHSMLILDPKNGENFKVTAEARRKALGQRIIRLDFFGVFGPGGHKLNVFDLLDPASPMLMANARQLADSLISKTGGEKDGLHFLNLAQELLKALIVYVVFHAPAQHRNLNLVRYLASDSGRLRKCFEHMKKSPHLGGLLAEDGSKLDSIFEREFSSVLSTLNQNLVVLADPLIADFLSESTFDVRAATRNTTTYCILPAKLMGPYAAIMKLVLNAFILVKKDEGLDESNELMLMLDEVGNLGRLDCLKDAVTVGRGMGLRCYFVLQALSQMESNFEKTQADSIIASCDLKIFTGVNDLPTAKVVSDMAGTATVTTPSYSAGDNRSGGGGNAALSFGSNRGRSYSPHARKLVMEDEVLRSPGTAYAFVTGQPPIAVSPIKYYEDRLFNDPGGDTSQPIPSIFSWAIAVLGLYFALPVAFALALEHLPALSSWTAREPRRAAPPVALDPAARLLGEIPTAPRPPRRPAPPRWPSEAACPKCQAVYELPEGYDGRPLRCEDCPTEFIPRPTR